jgi:hypothetical protein
VCVAYGQCSKKKNPTISNCKCHVIGTVLDKSNNAGLLEWGHTTAQNNITPGSHLEQLHNNHQFVRANELIAKQSFDFVFFLHFFS